MTALSIAALPHDLDAEDDGFADFYRKYDGPLTSYLRMGFRDCDVEAVAQETLYRALTHWTELRHMANPWPWLAVTARNLARNNIRDEKASSAAGLHVFDLDAHSADDVAEQVASSDQMRRLAKSMDVLTPLQRRLLTVMIEEGLTAAQVARRLGMKPGAVRMHLCRMRARLADRFQALGGQLAIGPLGVLAALGRLVRRHGSNAPRAAFATAGAGFAFSLAVVGVGVSGFAAGAPASGHEVVQTASARQLTTAPVHRAAVHTSTAGRAPVPMRRGTSAPGPAHAVTADGYHVRISQTPTQAGDVADAGVVLTTPVGTLNAGTPVHTRGGRGVCTVALAC